MFKSLIRTFAIVVAFIAGYMMPWLHVYGWAFKWMLIGMLFVTFLGIRFKRMKPERSHWLLVGGNLLIALAAWGVCRASFGAGYLAEAAFFVGVMPTATAAPVVMGLLGGSVEFMLTALLLTNGTICILLPFILPMVVGRGGFEIYLSVAQNIALVMLLPLVLALAARRFYPRAIAWPRKLKDVTFSVWVVILVLIAANASYDISSRDGISERVLEQIGALSLLICALNFGLGHLLGGRARSAECSQALGQKNTTLSIYLALTYSNPIAALGPTFYVLWHNLWNAWQLYRASERRRRNGK